MECSWKSDEPKNDIFCISNDSCWSKFYEYSDNKKMLHIFINVDVYIENWQMAIVRE